MAWILCKCCEKDWIEDGWSAICGVCGWEQDELQEADPDYMGGANNMSLNDARKYYAKVLKEKPDYRWETDPRRLKSAVINPPDSWNGTNYVTIDDGNQIISYDFDGKGDLHRTVQPKKDGGGRKSGV